MTINLWLCPVIAFLCGSIPFGIIIGRMRGVDIRQHGSGNMGATNVWRVLGKSAGIPCFLFDVLKGLIPTIIAISLIRFDLTDHQMALTGLKKFSSSYSMNVAQTMHVITGFCAILGHNYSPWAGFKGGKGIATSAGVLTALMPAVVVILILIWAIVSAAALPFLTILGSWYHGKIASGKWNKSLFVFTVIIAILAIWKHRSNIKRLLNSTEHSFNKKS
jgi:acyl phosphate:glycerol-3-phosphate acyltransferase